MRRLSDHAFRPIAPLLVVETGAQHVSLRSRRESIELTVLAPDLFRVRKSRARNFLAQPSWAVAKADWPAVPTQIRSTPRNVALQTAVGTLTLQLDTGSWRLRDRAGIEVFAALPQATGFAGEQARLTLALADDESLFGLGETTGTFNKRGLVREFWNTDVLGHAPAIHPSLRSLYVSIPFAVLLRHGRAAGLFWDNPARQTWDLGQTQTDEWRMHAATGDIDLYLFLGPTVNEVVSRYTELTGRMPLPPRWALGYHQCRYSYETRTRVEEIARTFRRKKIPCDVLYLDIHHMNGYRVFTFGKKFPKPAELMTRLRKQGFKVVTIVDPGVKNDPRFGVLKRGLAERAFVREAKGKKDYLGEVWPGKARFPDYTNARVRAWWGREQARLHKLGVAGIWNDMNEPANFALPSKTLPEDCLHNSDQGPLRHGTAHNVYGMQMARASRDGALAYESNQRPFVITRAGYAGVQRHALVWTGDNSSVWEHLADSVQMLLNLSVSGAAFCGSDVGGFLDNATGELLARWIQMAAFTPFFRNHSNIETHIQEPWAFDAQIEAICKRYIELRYQLLPYLYCLFVEAHHRGTPIMRPLFWHYPNDPVAVAAGDQFLLGPDLLVAPILRQGAVARSVYLPVGIWFNYWSGERFTGRQHVLALADLDTIPIFVRAGAIIPMSAVQQFVGQKKDSVVNLHLWPGGPGELSWYEDDGASMEYESGNFHERRLIFSTTRQGGELRLNETKGAFASEVKTWRVIVRGATRPYRVTVNGSKVPGRFDREAALFAFEFPNENSRIFARFR